MPPAKDAIASTAVVSLAAARSWAIEPRGIFCGRLLDSGGGRATSGVCSGKDGCTARVSTPVGLSGVLGLLIGVLISSRTATRGAIPASAEAIGDLDSSSFFKKVGATAADWDWAAAADEDWAAATEEGGATAADEGWAAPAEDEDGPRE